SLGLLGGSQPDVLVLCHEVGRTHVSGYGPQFPLPPLAELIELNLAHARLRRPGARCAGVSLNTGKLSAAKAEQVMAALEQELGLPVADPVRAGRRLSALVDACLAAEG
ncbi:MAG: DUF1611 domain-containing protein, partial [Wenzhouxiangella sp.]